MKAEKNSSKFVKGTKKKGRKAMKKFGTKKIISILLAVAVVAITMVILISAKPQKSIAAINVTPASNVSKGTVAYLCEAVTGSSGGGISCRIPMKVNTGDTTYCYNTFCMRKGASLSQTTGYIDTDIYLYEIKDINGNVTTSAVHWIFDNIYLDYDGGGVFSNTGVTPNAEELEYYRQNLTDIVCLYYKNKGKTYDRSEVYNSIKNLSEGRIFRAQQIAIWRFVNSKATSEALANSSLNTGVQKDIYYALTTIAETKLVEGYISPNSDVNTRIPTINTANAKLNTANSLIGPFTISNNNNLFSKELVTTLIVNNGDTILKNSKIVDKDGNEIANFNGTLYNSNKLYDGEFYIKLIDCEQIFENENLKVDINVDFNLNGYTTIGKYWTKDDGWQPLATLQRQPVSLNYNLPITRNATDLDLALKKTIRSVESVSGNNKTYIRLEKIDTTPLDNGETDALYSMQKSPVDVEVGDIVTYEIKVYNESTKIDAAAIEIVDYLPEGLELANDLDDCVWTNSEEISYEYKKDKKSIIITYGNTGTGNNPGVIQKYTINGGSEKLYGRSVFVKCRVVEGATDILTNTAEITAYGYINENGEYKTAVYGQDENTYINDRDSVVANWNSPNGKTMGYTEEYAYAIKNPNSVVDRVSYAWRNYADAQQDWVKDGGFHNFTGQQDDDDFEKLRVKQPDIALRKFIVSVKNDVDGETVYEGRTGRLYGYNTSLINMGASSDAMYLMKKVPVTVKIGDTVTYAIRIFNEGEILAKASKVVDYLPEGVTFKAAYLQLEDNSEKLELSDTATASKPGTVEYVEDSKMINLTYSGSLLNSYNSEQDTLDYYTFYIECTVDGDAKGTLTNVAEIMEYELANGITIDTDIDSASGNWEFSALDKELDKELYKTDGESRKFEEWIDYSSNSREIPDEYDDWIGQEDDDDFEKIVVEYQYMDLALRKNIASVQKEDGTVIDFNNDYSEEYDANIDTRIEKRKPTIINASWENFDSPIKGCTTLEYYHAKDAVTIQKGDKIIYNITVYNEGTLAATNIEIGDYLPVGLKLAENSSINASSGWEYTTGYGVDDLEDNGFIAIETVVKNNEFNAVLDKINLENKNVDCISVPVELEVTDEAVVNKYFTNRAEIKSAVALDDNGNRLSGVKDIDSDYNSIFLELYTMLLVDLDVKDYFDKYYENYNYTGIDGVEKTYFPGVEDDDDFETIYLYQPIDNKYNLKLIKVDALTGETLDGIKFEITGTISGSDTPITADDIEIDKKEYTTGAVTSSVEFNGKTYTNGIIEINNIKIDSPRDHLFKFEEKEFPEGMHYNSVDGWFSVEFKTDENGNVTPNKIYDITSGEILETYIDNDTNTVIVLIPNEKVLGKYSLNIQKVDKEDAPIDLPAVFIIEYPDGTKHKMETENGVIEIVKDLEFTEPGEDKYIVTEEIAPEGYVKDTSPITITVEKYFDEATNKFEVRILNSKITNAAGKEYRYFEDGDSTFVVEVPNIPITGEYNIRIRKVDYDNPDKVLEGVTFTIVTPLGAREVVTGADGYTEPVTIPIGTTKFTSVYSADQIQITENSLGQYEDIYNKVVDVIPVYVHKGIMDSKYVSRRVILPTTKVTLDDGTQVNISLELGDNTVTITVPNKEIKYPDLSLEKFITAVTTGEETKEITDREPVFKKDNTVTNGDGYIYTPKYEKLAPVQVNYNDIVTYTLRVYNEGEIDAYAAEIIDDIPEGVEFVPYTVGDGSVNDTYRWVMYKVVTDAEIALLPAGTEVKELNGKTQNGVTVYDKCVVTNDPAEADYAVTDYLSIEQGKARMDETTSENPNLLKAFEPTTQEKLEKGPDSRDVKIQFKVTHKPTTKEEADNTIINHAQISKDTDKNGIDITDRDSTENVWTDGEDDQDREKIKVNYFDLAEVKWVSEAIIIEDGVERVEKGNVLEELQNQYDHRLIYAMYPDTIGQYTDLEPVVKVDIPESKIDSIVVKFRYKIRVYNEGQIDGYAKEITDYIPDGMKFVQEDNPLWKEVGDGKVVTNQLADKLLTVGGEPETIEIVYTWINGKDNIGLKVNVAEISADYNEHGTPDVDSKPNNVTPGEDDIDDAPVLLSIRTGETVRTEYIVLGVAVVALIATGVVLIKKFVI